MAASQKIRQHERKFSEPLRWLGVFLRTLHIVFASIITGGIVAGTIDMHHLPWQPLVIATGLTLLAYEWLHDPNWPHCGKAILVYLHLLCLGLLHLLPEMAVPLILGALSLGSIGSHMPRHFRHWSLIYGPYSKK